MHFKVAGIGGFGGIKKLQATMAGEEFKMVETDNDQVDLLGGGGGEDQADLFETGD